MGKDFEEFLRDELNREVDEIMREVENDSAVADLEVPPELKERLFAEIEQYESEKAYEQLSEEDKQLIELGKVYRKKRKWKKYYVLAVAMVLAMAFGITSVGGPKRMWQIMEGMVSGSKRTTMNTDEKGTEVIKEIGEEEAYLQIEKMLGVEPVKLWYLPVGMVCQEVQLYDDIKFAQVIYGEKKSHQVVLRVQANTSSLSVGMDYYDKLISKYEIQYQGCLLEVEEYEVEEGGNRWIVHFIHQDVAYVLVVSEIEEAEFEKIIENLKFFKKSASDFVILCV